MSKFLNATALVLMLFLYTSLTIPVASGAVAVFTPTADASFGSLESWPSSTYPEQGSTTPLCWDNEGGYPVTMVGQIGAFDVRWGGKGMDLRCIQRYDVSSLGGIANLCVNSITIKTFSAGAFDSFWNYSGATLHPEIHPITAANRNWFEGPANPPIGGDGIYPIEGANCWNAKVTGLNNGVPFAREPWAGSPGLHTPGVDYDDTLKASRVLTFNDIKTTGQQVDFTFSGTSEQLTDLINSWLVDNYTLHRDNPGVVFTNPVPDPYASGLNQRYMFYSKHPFTSYDMWPIYHPEWLPQLIVNYSVVPEPGTFVLLAAGLIALLTYVRRKKVQMATNHTAFNDHA
jgi:hypothetical protein